jgi:hypothetical protein
VNWLAFVVDGFQLKCAWLCRREPAPPPTNQEALMPTVGKKKYPYTPKGRAAAKKAAKRKTAPAPMRRAKKKSS